MSRAAKRAGGAVAGRLTRSIPHAVALSIWGVAASAQPLEFNIHCMAELHVPRQPIPFYRGEPIEFLPPSSFSMTFSLFPQENVARVSSQLFTLREGNPYALNATPRYYVVSREGSEYVDRLQATVVRETFSIDRTTGELRHSLLLVGGQEYGQFVRLGRCRRWGQRL